MSRYLSACLLLASSFATAQLPGSPDLPAADAPRDLPTEREITAVRRWQTFAMVEVARPSSGYSLLFERRGSRWAFICIASSWMS